MKPHIQLSHHAYRAGQSHHGSRYYLILMACLLAFGLLYVAWSL